MKQMTYEQYFDKVLGCWIGKTLGGCGGVAYEGVKRKIENIDFKQIINTNLPNDDFDLQVMWLQGLEQNGPYLSSDQMAALWGQACKYPWSEYGYFMKNYKRGIRAPYSGWFNNEFFKNGMGCPIRSEIWAVSFPGMVDLAAKMALQDAMLDHAEDAMWGECFLARLESMLFLTDDVHTALEDCIESIDHNAKLYHCLSAVLKNHKNGMSFDDNLNFIYINYSHNDFTNCTQNIAIAILGVLHGGLDMEKTINITLIGGYDTDCTCATAGALVGIAIGAKAIPQELKALIDDSYVSAVDIKRRDNHITTFAEDSARVGVSMTKYLGSKELDITDIPASCELLCWNKPAETVELKVEYQALPAIGGNDTCPISVKILNGSGEAISGRLELHGLKEGWSAEYDDRLYTAAAGETVEIPVRIVTGNLKQISQKNILEARFVCGKEPVLAERFGVAGAVPYRVYGPFFEAADIECDSSWPSCHGDNSDLPSILSMVHNAVSLDKKYLDERAILRNPERYMTGFNRLLYAKEDLVDIESTTSVVGECGFILVCDVIFEQAQKAWVVIGNTDAFQIYLNGECCISKDEHFLWTPFNNAFIGQFQKGRNRLMIKLLKRTDLLKFSLGLKEYNEKHYHQSFWLDDLTYEVI